MLSPIQLLRADSPPILIAHGDNDDVLPVSNTIKMRDACIATGVPVECVICKGAKHCFDGKENDPPDEEIVRRTVLFFLRNLKVTE